MTLATVTPTIPALLLALGGLVTSLLAALRLYQIKASSLEDEVLFEQINATLEKIKNHPGSTQNRSRSENNPFEDSPDREALSGGTGHDIDEKTKDLASFSPSAPGEVFGLEGRDAMQLTYHKLGLSQSRRSFNLSQFFAGVGFLLIGVTLFYPSLNAGTNGSPTIGITAGAITEAVAALFAVTANKSRSLMADFFDRLRSDARLHESLRLLPDISDAKVRSVTQAILVLTLAGTDVNDATAQLLAGRGLAVGPPESPSL